TPRPPPASPLSPYTTLFRSVEDRLRPSGRAAVGGGGRRLSDRHATGTARMGATPVSRAHVVEVVGGGAGDAGRHRLSPAGHGARSEEHTSELQSRENLVCRL